MEPNPYIVVGAPNYAGPMVNWFGQSGQGNQSQQNQQQNPNQQNQTNWLQKLLTMFGLNPATGGQASVGPASVGPAAVSDPNATAYNDSSLPVWQRAGQQAPLSASDTAPYIDTFDQRFGGFRGFYYPVTGPATFDERFSGQPYDAPYPQ